MLGQHDYIISQCAIAIMLLCVFVGKHAGCMYVGIYICIDIHRKEGQYIFMQADLY